MVKQQVNEILAFFTEKGIRYNYHSWVTVPSDHVFATWFIPEERFDGSDLRAEYSDYTLEIHMFFKKVKGDEDFALEDEFEEFVRAAAQFGKRCGYDSAHDYFYTNYTFEFKEWFPNGT